MHKLLLVSESTILWVSSMCHLELCIQTFMYSGFRQMYLDVLKLKPVFLFTGPALLRSFILAFTLVLLDYGKLFGTGLNESIPIHFYPCLLPGF